MEHLRWRLLLEIKRNIDTKWVNLYQHYAKSVQIRSYFWSVFSCIRTEYGEIRSRLSPNTGKYGPEITPYLDTFHAVQDNLLLV